jgi:hypothetical protein
MAAPDDLKAAINQAVANIQANKANASALEAEKASHDQTRQALAAANAEIVQTRNDMETMKNQLAGAMG